MSVLTAVLENRLVYSQPCMRPRFFILVLLYSLISTYVPIQEKLL
jgi:hypothetical protein